MSSQSKGFPNIKKLKPLSTKMLFFNYKIKTAHLNMFIINLPKTLEY